MTRLTWLEASRLTNGTRVAFVVEHDIFPEALIPSGTVATVKQNDLNELSFCLYVLPDDAGIRDALKEWEGEIMLHPALSRDEDNREYGWDELSPLSVVEG